MRRSVLALRTICSPSRSSSVHSPHWPHFIVEAALLASTALALRNPLGHRAQATKPPRAATTLRPLRFLRLCTPHPPLFLPPGLFSAPAGVGVFLGITSLPWHTGRQAPRAPRRPSSRGRASSAGAGRPERCFPSAAHKGNLPGLQPAGFRSSIPPHPTPPHPTPPPRNPGAHSAGIGDPQSAGEVGQRPRTRAKVPLNAWREWVESELGHYLNDHSLLGSKRLFQASSIRKGRSEEETKRRRGGELFMAYAAQPSCCFKRAIKMNYD